MEENEEDDLPDAYYAVSGDQEDYGYGKVAKLDLYHTSVADPHFWSGKLPLNHYLQPTDYSSGNLNFFATDSQRAMSFWQAAENLPTSPLHRTKISLPISFRYKSVQIRSEDPPAKFF